MKTFIQQVLCAGILCTSVVAHAQDHSYNVVTTAVPILRVSPEARAGGMGDAGISISPDANAVFWNLAKLPFAPTKGGLTGTYAPWLHDAGPNDVFLASLGGFFKLGEDQAIGISMRYFNLGEVQFTDYAGQKLQTSHPREYSIDAGYTRKLGKAISLGVALRYINSSLASGLSSDGQTYKTGTSVAGDISFYYHGIKSNGAGWAAGVTISNLGSKISYSDNANAKEFLPANLGLGASYTARINEDNTITFALDANKLMVPTPPQDATTASLNDYHNKSVFGSWFSSFTDAPGGFSEEMKEWQVSGGLEYWYLQMVAMRAGYFYENKDKGGRQYLTFGVGLKFDQLGFNFSYLVPTGGNLNRNPMNQTLRASIIYDLTKN